MQKLCETTEKSEGEQLMMTNYEKYKDFVIDCIKKNDICDLADKVYGTAKCSDRRCYKCTERVADWLNEEYEPHIDWSKVPVDTPVIVSYSGKKYKRHFASYDKGFVMCFDNGTTHWSCNGTICTWKEYEVELARKEDIEKYSI